MGGVSDETRRVESPLIVDHLIPKQYQKMVERLGVEYAAARVATGKERKAQKENIWTLEHVEEALNIAQQVAQEIQEQAHRQLSQVVTACLASIFDDPYEFEIQFERKRGKTEAKLVFTRDGEEYTDPLGESGGGAVDIASFALRISALVLQAKTKLRKVVALDEPFRFLSEEYWDKANAMLDNLAEKMGIQFVIITHVEELEGGKVVRP